MIILEGMSLPWRAAAVKTEAQDSGDSPEREEPGIWEPSTVVLLAPVL